MTGTFKYWVFGVLAFFAFITLMTLLNAPLAGQELEKYKICIEAGGEYSNESSECDMP